jgi:hypothetical protein
MKGDESVGILVVFGLVGMLIGFAATSYAPEIIGIGNALTTFFATLVGAWGAFHFEARRRREQERTAIVQAGNRMLFDLYMVWNDYTLIEKELTPELAKVHPSLYWCQLKPRIFVEPRDGILDVSRLEFMLESPKAQLLVEVQIQYERYRQYWDLARRRATLFSTAQDLWAASGIVSISSPAQLRAVTGPAMHGQLESLTRFMLEFLPQNRSQARIVFDALRDELKLCFPGRKFIAIEESTGSNAAN